MALFKNYFYYNLIEKYSLIFGNLFSDIDVKRFSEDGSVLSTVNVPVNYSEKEKWSQRFDDPDHERQTALILPRISYVCEDIQYDSSRKLARNNRVALNSHTDTARHQMYTPWPAIMSFEVTAIAKTKHDLNQIIEQILPAFSPDVVIRAKLGEDFEVDLSIAYQNLQLSDTYDDDFATRRTLTATFSFFAKVYFFTPINNKQIILDLTAPVYQLPVNDDIKKSFLLETYNFDGN